MRARARCLAPFKSTLNGALRIGRSGAEAAKARRRSTPRAPAAAIAMNFPRSTSITAALAMLVAIAPVDAVPSDDISRAVAAQGVHEVANASASPFKRAFASILHHLVH